LTLANPAALARNRNKQASLRCVGIVRLNRRHASQEGCGDVRGRSARGLREPKAVALQAKRIRLAGRRITFTPLGSLPHSFLMRIRQRTPTSGRQGGQSSSRLSHLRCFTSLAPRICSPPNTGTPNNCRGASSLRAVICRRLLSSAQPQARGLRNRKPKNST
jgi:hypothetical protein